MALLLVVGLQVTSKQAFTIRVIFYVAIAVIIIFQFFPATWNNFIGAILPDFSNSASTAKRLSGTCTIPVFGSIVQNGKFAASAPP